MFRRTIVLVVLLVLWAMAPPVHALRYTTYNFVAIPEIESPINAAIGEANLFLDVIETSPMDPLQFVFRNTDPCGSGIMTLYFEDSVGIWPDSSSNLLSNYSIDGSVGNVNFVPWFGAPPRGNNLIPSWQYWWYSDFVATKAWSFDKSINGPGEALTILADGNFDDVVQAMDDAWDALQAGVPLPVDVIGLRMAVHVGGFEDCGSESFVTDGRSPIIPEPSMFLLGILGAGLGAMRRRRKG